MAINRDDFTFSPEFAAALTAGRSLAELSFLDPKLRRDPRVMVPIDLQALVVGATERVEHADVANPGLLASIQSQDAAAAPEPPPAFTDLAAREPGVYLHWALPDGLTRGSVVVEDESTEVPRAETLFRPLPNRWVVLRAWRARPRQAFQVEAWVVESERGRSVKLADWQETESLSDEQASAARTPDLPPEQLNVVTGGDPAWAAVFDNVEDRFAFHDDLEGVPQGSVLTYLVVGWYSKDNLDPLDGTPDVASFEEVLGQLGWRLPDSVDFSRHYGYAVRRHEGLSQLGAETTPPPPAGVAAVIDDGPEIGATQANPSLLRTAVKPFIRPEPWWPQQSLFHGTVCSVTRSGQRRDQRPQPGAVSVGVGQTGAESFAALSAASLAEEARHEQGERVHTANQYGILEAFDQDDGLVRLEEEIHQRAYQSEHGGWVEERVRDGDAFAHLRPRRRDVVTAGEAILGTGTLHRAFEDQLSTGGPVSFRFTQMSFHETLEVHQAKADLIQKQQASAGVGQAATFSGLSGAATRGGRQRGLDLYADPPDRLTQPDDLQGRPEVSSAEDVARRAAEQVRYRTVRRPKPRWFYPQDPVVTLRGLNRPLRHGFDGRFEPDETVACRLSADRECGYGSLVSGRDLLATRLDSAQVPDEVERLLCEALLQEPAAVDTLTEIAVDRTGLPRQLVARRFEAEAAVFRRSLIPGSRAPGLLPASLKQCIIGSPVGVTVYTQPWVPLYLEWQLELAVDSDLGRWRLGELDLAAEGDAAAGASTTLTGRSLLNPAGSKKLANDIAKFLDEERNLDQRGDVLVSDGTAGVLGDLEDAIGRVDALSAGLDGLREHLLGFDTTVRLFDDEGGEVLPARLPRLLRGGVVTLSRLRVVDAFGRTLEVGVGAGVVVSEALEVDGADTAQSTPLLAPPRLNAPSRLWFRLVDHLDDARDASIDQENPDLQRNPVAAWLLPDHVDRALEIFSSQGDPLGQLRHDRLGGAVIWEGSPGRPGALGAPPSAAIADRHAEAFARGIVERHAVQLQAAAAADDANEPGESPLQALLRVVDTTLWTVDPFGQTGGEHYSLLTGRPIAMVRARLYLEVRSDVAELGLQGEAAQAREQAFRDLASLRFDVRLGALTRFEDGLLGYFVNDDYRHFFPVHSQVPLDALPSGPHEGYFGPAARAEEFHQNLDPVRIESPFIVDDPTVTVRPGTTVYLTLLMDPGGKVHATSGILPRKSVSLPRSFIDVALARIAPSFRVGPVLVDPTTVRMPMPSGLPEEQAWTRRDSPVSWRDDPIQAATQHAYLPDESVGAQEGYIRVLLEEDD